eukprot:scaffold35913_cov62-Attheya_sp.AAC.1
MASWPAEQGATHSFLFFQMVYLFRADTMRALQVISSSPPLLIPVFFVNSVGDDIWTHLLLGRFAAVPVGTMVTMLTISAPGSVYPPTILGTGGEP